ncbi:MAG: aminopeptidase N C-terminal domain-containing protein [Burkholderiaceae bacterium]
MCRRSCSVVHPQRIHTARESMRAQLAAALREDWAWAFEQHQVGGAYSPDPVSVGQARAGATWRWPCCAWTPRLRAIRSGRAAPTSASRTRST